MHIRLTRWAGGAIFALVCLGAIASPLRAQIRVVTYNTLDRPLQSQQFAPWEVVLEAIGDQEVLGIAQPISIMALQEVSVPDDSARNIAGILNDLYGVSSYQVATASYGDGYNLQSIVYDSNQVELLGAVTFAMGVRPGFRANFRPVGYDSPESEFYVYSTHLKAFPGFETQRGAEASALRHNGNLLGPDANLIYAGDFNLTSGASEPAYSNMLASGNGQAIDPENGDFSNPLKKSYSSTGAGSRIDFQFISTELNDDEGLDLIDGSYRVFNRDQVGSRIITNPTELTSASDHLPVVADYQLPAWMDVVSAPVPQVLQLGEDFLLDFTVSNIAPVVAAIGADELDYALSWQGDIGGLLGPTTGMDLALDGGALHQFALDTSSVGFKTGSILISSNSPGVQNGLISLDVMYQVVFDPAIGDVNLDGIIDLFDLNAVQNNWDPAGAVPHMLSDGDINGDGRVDLADRNLVQNNWAPGGYLFSDGSSTDAQAMAAPEPASAALLLIGLLCFAGSARRRRKR